MRRSLHWWHRPGASWRRDVDALSPAPGSLAWLAAACVLALGCRDQEAVVVATIEIPVEDGASGMPSETGEDGGAVGNGGSSGGTATGDAGLPAAGALSPATAGAGGADSPPEECNLPRWIYGISQIVASDCTIPISDEALVQLVEQFRAANPQPLPVGEERGLEICDIFGAWIYPHPSAEAPEVLKVCPAPCAFMRGWVSDTFARYRACIERQQGSEQP